MTTRAEIHVAAGNLLLAFYVRSQIPDHLQARVVADERFARLCEAGCTAGLAQSPAELAVVVADVVEQLPPPPRDDRGGAWIWLMEARWILTRRLGGEVELGEAA